MKSGQRDLLDDRVDNLVGAHAFALGFIGQHQAMSQAVVHDGAHIFGVDEVTPLSQACVRLHLSNASEARGLPPTSIQRARSSEYFSGVRVA